jgi:hypothetical protein
VGPSPDLRLPPDDRHAELTLPRSVSSAPLRSIMIRRASNSALRCIAAWTAALVPPDGGGDSSEISLLTRVTPLR